MASNRILFKPQSQGRLNPGGLSVLVPANKRFRSIEVLGAGGNVLENLRKSSVGQGETGSTKFFSNKPGGSFGNDLRLRVVGGDGRETFFNIPSGSSRFEGDFDAGEDLETSSRGGRGGGGGGDFGQFSPTQTPGGFSFVPPNLQQFFPSPVIPGFESIGGGRFEFTDPQAFAEQFGDFTRGEILKDFDLSKDLALEQIDLELEGLEQFTTAAGDIKRGQLSLDNIFNLQERRRAVDTALPGARGRLDERFERADALAEGRLPSEIEDRALSVSLGSEAADVARTGGFGPTSGTARNISGLLSARERLDISQIGEQRLSQLTGEEAELFLPPTQFSDVGAQIRTTPEVGAGRLAAQNLATIGARTGITAQNALTSTIQQQQFGTNLQQRTQEFNATGLFNASQIGAGIQNQFAQNKFDYQVGFGNAVTGAFQTDLNTQFALEQQQRFEQIFRDTFGQAQDAQNIRAGFEALGALPQVIGSINQIVESTTGGEQGPSATLDPGIDPTQTPIQEVVGDAPPGSTAVQTPRVPSAPPGYEVAGQNSDGSPIFIPSTSRADVASFEDDTGRNVSSVDTSGAASTSAAVQEASGLYSEPGPGRISVGNDNAGRPLYADETLANSDDIGVGGQVVNVLSDVLNPLDVLQDADLTSLQKLSDAASNLGNIQRLTESAQNGDASGFVNDLLTMTAPSAIDKIVAQENKDDANLALTAYKLYQNWDRLSDTQKGMAIANLGIRGLKTTTGQSLFKVEIPGTAVAGTPTMNVGQAIGLFQQGYNVYSLVDNWDNVNDVHKITGGIQTAAGVAETARQFGMLGTGTQGAAVGISAAELTAAGFTSVPAGGIGAISGPAASIPSGYTGVQTLASGEVLAVPTANLESSALGQFGGALRIAGGVAALAAGAFTIYQGWGTGGEKGAINGAVGGASMAAGLYTLGATNPYLLAAVVAVSALSGLISAGKGEDQIARDGVRSRYQQLGLSDDNHNVTLADGTLFDIGREDSFTRAWSDPSRRTKGQEGIDELKGYNVDYTSDLGYAAGMGGVALSRLLGGGKAKNIDDMGAYLGTAALSNVGTGEMTEASFAKTMQNMRAFYSQAGVKSREEAFALANQAYAEGRIDDNDVVTMHQAFNMIFRDDGFAGAQRLMGGRWRGLEVADENPADPYRNVTSGRELATQDRSFGSSSPVRRDRDQVIASNRERFSQGAISG